MAAEVGWSGGWDADRAAKRRAWLATTPAERLRWLEEVLDLALASGALERDRRRRAQAAAPHERSAPAAASAPPGGGATDV